MSRFVSALSGPPTRAYARLRFREPPIILGGPARSGTTLLLSVLGGHSHILAIEHETTAFHPTLRPEKLLSGLLFAGQGHKLRRIEPGVTRFCEKTPGNVRRTQRILDFFKGRVRIVHILRDGRDVITSRHPTEPDRYWVSIERWLIEARSALEADARDEVMTIKYEDLVASPRGTLSRVCAFLDEPFEERLMDYHRHTNVKTNSAWAASAAPLHRSSLKKWEKPEHRQRLDEFLSNSEAVALMQAAGYL